ncbi:unnamed protein product [Didymodactylos carnosus]|uniref:Tetratricopeptide repeat protein n=1 Tax=Didymodactylos carnosus TaxID=1234261 RepID=A0A814SGA2_9BILA|nr:unnamed protein product [Didymodactylos carnosus]CAF3910454.1 unnamed protein product [Didymodactylos carnosus]
MHHLALGYTKQLSVSVCVFGCRWKMIDKHKVLMLADPERIFEKGLETQNYSEALFNHEKALEIYESHSLSAYNHCHEKAVILQGIAYVHLLTENYELALVNYKNALTIGLTAPQIISTSNIIGLLYKNQFKNYSEALSYCEKALEMYENSLTHYTIAEILYNIGTVHHERKDYELAMFNYKKALSIQLTCLPVNHTGIANTYYRIGIVQQVLQNYCEALINYKKALSIKLKYLSSDDTDIADFYISVAITQSNKKIIFEH